MDTAQSEEHTEKSMKKDEQSLRDQQTPSSILRYIQYQLGVPEGEEGDKGAEKNIHQNLPKFDLKINL